MVGVDFRQKNVEVDSRPEYLGGRDRVGVRASPGPARPKVRNHEAQVPHFPLPGLSKY